MKPPVLILFLCLFLLYANSLWSQDATPEHIRVTKVEVAGRRIELKALKGAILFSGPKIDSEKSVPLIVHFHGAPWLIEYHIARRVPNAVLITIQLGPGSSVYNRPFDKTETFQATIDEARQVFGLKREWSSITLAGWSAGYGAVRAILRNEKYFKLVDNILLLDGIHASYSPEGRPLAEGGFINAADVEPFVKFAREAAKGKKAFVMTHSEIVPGSYASTTECVNHVITTVGLTRESNKRDGPPGMHQLTAVDKKRLHVRGYAGNTAADHIDHIHSMGEWIGLLKIK